MIQNKTYITVTLKKIIFCLSLLLHVSIWDSLVYVFTVLFRHHKFLYIYICIKFFILEFMFLEYIVLLFWTIYPENSVQQYTVTFFPFGSYIKIYSTFSFRCIVVFFFFQEFHHYQQSCREYFCSLIFSQLSQSNLGVDCQKSDFLIKGQSLR